MYQEYVWTMKSKIDSGPPTDAWASESTYPTSPQFETPEDFPVPFLVGQSLHFPAVLNYPALALELT